MSPGNKRMCFGENNVFGRKLKFSLGLLLELHSVFCSLPCGRLFHYPAVSLIFFYYHLKHKQTMILLCLTQVVHFNFVGLHY